MAYAVAAQGPDRPVLYGVSAARQWHAIPRAIAVATIATPVAHKTAMLKTGLPVVFTKRRTDLLDTQPVTTVLGQIRVTTPEQTMIDLITTPSLGGMPGEAAAAIKTLTGMVDAGRLRRLAGGLDDQTREKITQAMGDAG